MERKLTWLCLLFGASVLIGGCAWRAENTEHYFGPVLFRYAAPPQANAHVSEQRHLLVLIEAGQQWGVSVGWNTRVAVSPRRGDGGLRESEKAPPWRWSMPLGLFGSPEEGRWNLSLIYLVGERVPSAEFVSRSTIGARMGIGSEVKALSIGAVRETQLRPRSDAVYALSYDSRRPLETNFQVWDSGGDFLQSLFSRREETQP